MHRIKPMSFAVCFLMLIASFSRSSAQDGILDFSKPQTGPSQFVFNADGTPVQLGVRSEQRTEVDRLYGNGNPPSCGSACAGAPKTVHVDGYTRKDGTYVEPYYRAAPGTAHRK